MNHLRHNICLVLLGIMLFLTGSHCCHAQSESRGGVQLFPFRQAALWGYVDAQGKVAIPAQYRSAGKFSEGLAAVRIEGTFGYIDPKGNMVIPAMYDAALDFEDGVAIAYVDRVPRLLDRSGNLLLKRDYQGIERTTDRNIFTVRAMDGLEGLVDRQGREVLPCVYRSCDQNSELSMC